MTAQEPTPKKTKMAHTLILFRHGDSEFNSEGRFAGWIDTHLSEKGRKEAAHAGELLKNFEPKPDVLHTSKLQRSCATADIALEKIDRLWVPVYRTWRLNERHYGALQGRVKHEVLEEVGEEQFMTWRRTYDIPPPPCKEPETDERYKGLDPLPRSESLKMLSQRLLPYWTDVIAPQLKEGKTVLVVAHGSTVRALVKHLDGVSDADIKSLNIPTGIPLVYELDDDLNPIGQRVYLDPAAAVAGANAVAHQGQ